MTLNDSFAYNHDQLPFFTISLINEFKAGTNTRTICCFLPLYLVAYLSSYREKAIKAL